MRDNKVISLFSGSGGMDIGLEAAGFETVACVEIDKDCRATLRHNRPQWKLIDGNNPELPGDIRAVTGQEILEAVNLRRGEPALIVGGPPCQPFSDIGKRRGADDPVNGDLYAEYVRIVKECLPKAFIFENVEGLRQGKHNPIRDYLISELSGAGYAITHAVVNPADYGVPQRRRFIMLGLRGEQKPCRGGVGISDMRRAYGLRICKKASSASCQIPISNTSSTADCGLLLTLQNLYNLLMEREPSG